MAKCLISKLYGSVDNDNLQKLNEFKFIVSKTSNTTLYSYITTEMIAFVKSIGGYFEATLDNGAYFQKDYDPNAKRHTTLKFTDIQNETTNGFSIKFPNTGTTTLTIKGKYYFPNYFGSFIPPYNNPDDFKYIHLYRIFNSDSSRITISELIYPEDVRYVRAVNFPAELLRKMTNLKEIRSITVDNASILPASLTFFSGTIKSWPLNSRVSGNMMDLGDGVTFDSNDSIDNMLVDMSNLTGNKDSRKRINVWALSAYTPSEAAKAAIRKLKSECNYSTIKVNDVEQTGN